MLSPPTVSSTTCFPGYVSIPPFPGFSSSLSNSDWFKAWSIVIAIKCVQNIAVAAFQKWEKVFTLSLFTFLIFSLVKKLFWIQSGKKYFLLPLFDHYPLNTLIGMLCVLNGSCSWKNWKGGEMMRKNRIRHHFFFPPIPSLILFFHLFSHLLMMSILISPLPQQLTDLFIGNLFPFTFIFLIPIYFQRLSFFPSFIPDLNLSRFLPLPDYLGT